MKIAVAVASARVPAWQRWCVDALRALDGAAVRVVQVDAAPWRPPSGFDARVAGPALKLTVLQLDPGDVNGADVVLDLTGANIAAQAPHGVWSFRLGESDDATLPFAREVARAAGTFDIALTRRDETGRELLRAGRFGITVWYPSTLRIALSEAARWPATLVAALLDGIELEPAGPDAAPVRAPHSALDRIRFLNALAVRLAGGVFEMMFEVVEWNVGFVEGGARMLLSGEPLDVRWLPRPAPLTFIADPFVVDRDGKRVLFVEEFDYARNRGVIEALELDERGGVIRRTRALDLPAHLSYPFPLEIDGTLYLMPESCAANEVALYRCVRFPDVWERESALFPGFDGVDTTLFSHDGRWWAFMTRWSQGSTLGLHVYHAPSPRGPWTAHALNPVVVDVASARPGGQPFVVDGVLYRPAQDCSRSYGAGIALARIDALTASSYRETVVRHFDAHEFGRYADGVHTISFASGVVVVDGKHVYRDVRKLGWALRRLRHKIGRFLTRATPKRTVPAQS